MNKFVKYAMVGLAGYLIGHYELKYKVMKSLLQVDQELDKRLKEEKEKEDEAQ